MQLLCPELVYSKTHMEDIVSYYNETNSRYGVLKIVIKEVLLIVHSAVKLFLHKKILLKNYKIPLRLPMAYPHRATLRTPRLPRAFPLNTCPLCDKQGVCGA